MATESTGQEGSGGAERQLLTALAAADGGGCKPAALRQRLGALFSYLANASHFGFFSVHMLHIIYRLPIALDVVSAVFIPWRQLATTLIVAVVILWIFTIVIFSNLETLIEPTYTQPLFGLLRREADCQRECRAGDRS